MSFRSFHGEYLSNRRTSVIFVEILWVLLVSPVSCSILERFLQAKDGWWKNSYVWACSLFRQHVSARHVFKDGLTMKSTKSIQISWFFGKQHPYRRVWTLRFQAAWTGGELSKFLGLQGFAMSPSPQWGRGSACGRQACSTSTPGASLGNTLGCFQITQLMYLQNPIKISLIWESLSSAWTRHSK